MRRESSRRSSSSRSCSRAYVLLDGYDLGVGADFVLRRVARHPSARAVMDEHRTVLERQRSVAHRRGRRALRALSESLRVVVLRILLAVHRRALAVDVPRHRAGTARPLSTARCGIKFWDAALLASSGLLIVLFGVALGNLLRGVPLDAARIFSRHVRVFAQPIRAVGGRLRARRTGAARAPCFSRCGSTGRPPNAAWPCLRRIWWGVLALYLGVTVATYFVRGLPASPWLYVVPLISLGALIAMIPLLASRPIRRGVRGFVGCSSRSLAGRSGRLALPVPHPRLSARQRWDVDLRGVALAGRRWRSPSRRPSAGRSPCSIYGTVVTRAMAGKVRVE